MKFWLAFLFVAIFTGCFEDPESEALPYPPLRKDELVGCWKYVKPTNACDLHCFDRSNGYFYADSFSYPRAEVREDSGTYTLDMNLVKLHKVLKTTLGNSFFEEIHLEYAILNDSMHQIASRGKIGGAVLARVSPDSFPCSLKPWTLFQKPAGWDSLIKPY